MLFNSYPYILGFLPVTLAVFFLLARASHRLAAGWLVAASLFFYAWWSVGYLALLALSVLGNFAIGSALVRAHRESAHARRRALLGLGILGNLGALGYYKYANFFLANVDLVLGTHWTLGAIILPLGISFFTFTQIAFLVDAYRGEVDRCDFLHYSLFVTYFPHLIAGPILYHKEMMPQFADAAIYRRNHALMAVGLTVFFIGLFKKSVLADGVAPYVPFIFTAVHNGMPLTFLEAWAGMLAYTMQLYFDFSGYTDMAIGASLLFGIVLPQNFHSPYKSANIFDFWRRWHMTLTRFLRAYVYTPLTRNCRTGRCLQASLVLTMVVAGIWHGAGWTFAVFGLLQGAYMVVCHAWRGMRRRLGRERSRSTRLGRGAAILLTFLSFVVSLAFFRADNLADALAILRGMAGFNGLALPTAGFYELSALGPFLKALGVPFRELSSREVLDPDAISWLLLLLPIVFFLPNTQQIVGRYQPLLNAFLADRSRAPAWLQWRPDAKWAIVIGVVAFLGITSITKVSPFLYYQF